MELPMCYRIVVRGRLSDSFAVAIDGMTTEPGEGETALVGRVRDQAHLYGILERLRDFGLELLRVEEGER
jgi:hypothetical protein